jgi:hypothetical protein
VSKLFTFFTTWKQFFLFKPRMARDDKSLAPPAVQLHPHELFPPIDRSLFSGGENAKKKEQQYVSECPVNLLGFSFRQPPTM